MRQIAWMAVVLMSAGVAMAQAPNALQPFVKIDAPAVVLENVRVIDGTGAAAKENQMIVIENGKITFVGPETRGPADCRRAQRFIDMTGKTVFPGLVGMHEHLFYPLPDGGPGLLPLYGEMADSAPRLYLAGGVTAARTAGSLEPYTDISVKQLIDAGTMPGPKLFLTGPYLEGSPSIGPQLHTLTGPDDAARLVNYWSEEGMTSYKAYMHITPEELKAAADAAHAKGLKITGHLCAVGFQEAASLGIDNLEHGLVVDTEFYSGKKEGVCPGQRPPQVELAKMDVEGPQIQGTIKDLIAHHVAVTSTLAIFESFAPNRPPLNQEMRVRTSLLPDAWSSFVTTRAAIAQREADAPAENVATRLLQMEMQFEHDFVKQGGVLMAGCDPTGYGGVLPGFGDQRESGTAGGGGVHAGRGDPYCDGERRDLAGRGRALWHDCGGEGCGSGGGGWQSREEHRGCGEGGRGVQGWGGVRPGEADCFGAGVGGVAVDGRIRSRYRCRVFL